MNETGFQVMGEAFKGSFGALIFWAIIILLVYLLLKYKVMK